jgi:hypothetical protein
MQQVSKVILFLREGKFAARAQQLYPTHTVAT